MDLLTGNEPLKNGDKVKEKGGYNTGLVTGLVSDGEVRYLRVFWNGTNDMYHETVPENILELVERRKE